ncbi:Clp protease N-terminal domain-containing protein [Streptomyces sp. NPDC058391]|uniref:Clp protease N-terminal domain-containing protein n=1 Tax=Streptomyces sp. NPDC058391 TaxID=3346476 RepID=UPI00364E39FC
MENRPPVTERTGAAHLSAEATEFAPDVMDLLGETLLRALKHASPKAGTEDLLAALVMGDSAAGAAIAPGMRRAGALSGVISGRAGRGWVSDDSDDSDDSDSDDGTSAVAADEHEHEVAAAWRLAQWRTAQRSRRPVTEGDQQWPELSGALRACLLHALRLARGEASPGVRCRHVARALLDFPDSRAREVFTLRRLDLAAAYAALDTLDTEAAATAGTDEPESAAVTLLLRAGVLEDRGNWLARALTSWMTWSTGDGTPVLFAVSAESSRQAVRCGRSAAEPVDLLLAVLALDRALSLAGRSLPEERAAVNEAAGLLRTHGVRPASLALSAVAADPLPVSGEVPLSAEAERTLAVARLSAAEHRATTVGTVHLVAALLDDAEGPVAQRLRAQGVDLAALKTGLSLRLSA